MQSLRLQMQVRRLSMSPELDAAVAFVAAGVLQGCVALMTGFGPNPLLWTADSGFTSLLVIAGITAGLIALGVWTTWSCLFIATVVLVVCIFYMPGLCVLPAQLFCDGNLFKAQVSMSTLLISNLLCFFPSRWLAAYVKGRLRAC